VQAVAQANLSPPRYASTREPTAWNCECRAMTDMAKTIVDREATVECTCPVHRGPGGGMHEQTGRLNWGTTRRRKCRTDECISRSAATSGSDEAIVSNDLAGQHNRSGSQGPLDESVWGWETAFLVRKDHRPPASTLAPRISRGLPRRRSWRTSRLKPYWGKPDVRNFRGGGENTMAECVSQTLNGPCDNPALYHAVRSSVSVRAFLEWSCGIFWEEPHLLRRVLL
jgi:hypothetical protein